MHLSTLFSNLLVATQLGSYPSFAYAYAYGRSIALFPDTLSHSLEPRQFCAVHDCNVNVECQSGREATLHDDELDAAISLTIIRTSMGGIGLLIQNGLGVDVRVSVTAFNGQFRDYRDIGTAGVNWIFGGAHYDIWHATVVETRDVPDKSHGAQPLHVNPKGNPKGHQATGVDDKKPKTAGGACPGSCKGASWTVSCRGQCT
ncbi:hypothetical protein EG328_003180 [Venturia inaequalis]|uniref:Uncharacterized protein n=1 Tax=Venturia inaequalis TaxID=5025 RepID=A0A8H3YXF4_VENIN|nr:hypothetical protein EG328_003180 [Venturia inaequalis]